MEEKRITLRLPLEAVIFLERAKDDTGKSINQLTVDAVIAQYCPTGDTVVSGGVMVSPSEERETSSSDHLAQILALLQQYGERLEKLENRSVVSNGVMVSPSEERDEQPVALALLTKKLGVSKDNLKRWSKTAWKEGTYEALEQLGRETAAHDKYGRPWYSLDDGHTYWGRANPLESEEPEIESEQEQDTLSPSDTMTLPDTIDDTRPDKETPSDTIVSKEETVLEEEQLSNSSSEPDTIPLTFIEKDTLSPSDIMALHDTMTGAEAIDDTIDGTMA
ncbi:hypothetical protein [Chroococcidiopsis sp. CCMEE 29]|uniref:hypothetical protein n=1 Tax=Chroococcidiopsis sp. CCMEE 29 TaxID=155894 RepID=UPI0020207486|nr:hypothetical protein [Chroococcidiopsis sp. CCMEE 29]